MYRNLIEDMDWRGDKAFSTLPFNEVDALILSVLIYQRFEDASEPVMGKTMSELLPVLCPVPSSLTKGTDTPRCRLWEKTAASKRFSVMKLDVFSSSLSKEEENEEQFAAAVFSTGDGKGYVIFRGTDESITGWKEDLALAYEDEIPSERKALEFLTVYGRNYSSLVLAGHSKGGTLALYAVLKADDEISQKVKKIYAFDAPGLAPSLTLSPEWRNTNAKTESYVPSTSIVGMLFNNMENEKVVKAVGPALLQHDPFSWCTDKAGFVYEKDIPVLSRLNSATMRSFFASTTKEEREELVGVINRVLDSMKEENVFRIPVVIFERFDLFNNELLSLTDEEKIIVKKLFKAFMASRRESYRKLRKRQRGGKEEK